MAPRLMTAALSSIERGWFVFPLRPSDKRPLPNFKRWEEKATRDPDTICRRWANAPYNIGVATGPSKLVVIDCDTARDSSSAQWHRVEEGVEVAGQLLPRTFCVATPSGGLHLYYNAPEGVTFQNTAGKLGQHIDTRGAGGYVVGPGSVRSEGYYTITEGAPVAVLPGWLVDALTRRTQPAPVPRQLLDGDMGYYLQAILDGEARRIMSAAPGGRNHALNIAAFILGQLVRGGELSGEVATCTLSEAARKHVGVRGFTETEMVKTINSGLRAGMLCPRQLSRRPGSAAE